MQPLFAMFLIALGTLILSLLGALAFAVYRDEVRPRLNGYIWSPKQQRWVKHIEEV